MPDNRSLKEKVLESYNAEKGAFQQNINAKDSNINVSKIFEKKIDDLLGGSFRKTKEKKIEEFLDFYQTKLKNYDTDYRKGNIELHGKELTGILLTLREALEPNKKFDEKTWKGLKKQFKDYREKEEGPLKIMNDQVKELTTSIEDIHKCKDKDDKGLEVILKRDFDNDKIRKTGRETGYSDDFYVKIDKKIKDKTEFKEVKTSINDRVTEAERRIKELEKKKDQEVIGYFIEMVSANKITSEQVKDFSDDVKSKIMALLSPQAVASQVNDSQRSIEQAPTAVAEISDLSGGTVMENEEKAKKEKEKEKEIFENKVTVGAEVAAIGGAALLGAVTIGTGGLILPIAVGVGTVVAGALAINEQDKIGKETDKEKTESQGTIQAAIQKHVVDNPSRIVTKRVIDFGESVRAAFGINQAKDDKGRD